MAALVGLNSSEISSSTATMQQGWLNVYKYNQQQAEDNLQQQEQDDQKKGFFGKIASHAKVITEAVVITGALATGNFEIAAAVVATMVLTHYAGQMSQGIADALQAIDPNMSDAVAKMIGDAITVVIIATASIACGQAAGAFEEGEAAGAEIATKAATTAAKDGAEEAGTEMADLAAEAGAGAAGGVERSLETKLQPLLSALQMKF